MGAKLLIVDGPDRGREFPLQDGENVMGRTAETPIELPSSKVSRRHAAIHVSGGRVEIEDLGSSNGTFLNGKRVTRSPVPAGSKIAVGEFVLQVVAANGAARPAGGPASGGRPAAAPVSGPRSAAVPVKPGARPGSGKAVVVARPPSGAARPVAGRGRVTGPTPVVPSEGAKRAADQVVRRIGGFAWRSQIFLIVGAVGLALFLDVLFVVSRSQNDYASLAQSRARLIAQQLAAQNAFYMAMKEDLLLSDNAARDEVGVKETYLIGRDGLILYPPTLRNAKHSGKIVEETLAKTDFSVSTGVNKDDPTWVDIAAPVQFWNRDKGQFELVGVSYIVFAPEEVAKRATSAVTLYVVAALILAVAGFGGALLMIRATEPAVQRLQEDTELLIRGDLKKVGATLRMKELEALAHSINRLYERAGNLAPVRAGADEIASAGFPRPGQAALALPAQAGPVDNAGADAVVRALVSAIPDAAIVVDADSNVVEVNKPAEKMFGLIPSRVRGKHLIEAITDHEVLNAVLDLLNEIAAAPNGVVSRAIRVGAVDAQVTAAGVRQGNELAGSAIVFGTRASAESAGEGAA